MLHFFDKISLTNVYIFNIIYFIYFIQYKIHNNPNQILQCCSLQLNFYKFRACILLLKIRKFFKIKVEIYIVK